MTLIPFQNLDWREERVCLICKKLLKLSTEPTKKGRNICTRRRCMPYRLEDQK